jgi:hypothetical protein
VGVPEFRGCKPRHRNRVATKRNRMSVCLPAGRQGLIHPPSRKAMAGKPKHFKARVPKGAALLNFSNFPRSDLVAGARSDRQDAEKENMRYHWF